MVDQWPSRVAVPPSIMHDDHRQGVAALSPQFDLAVSPARRSVAPIGSLSPQSFVHALSPPPKAHTPSHNPFAPPIPLNLNIPVSTPPLSSAPAPPADLLAELTHFSDPHSAQLHSALPATRTSQSANHLNSHFDMFGLANLDLGPSVKPPLSSPSNLVPSLHPSAFDFPFTASPTSTYPTAPQSAPPPSTSPRRDAAHPTRCVQLRNIPPGIDDDDIRRLLTKFGPLRDLGAQQRSRGGHGSLLATYYDLRHARSAVRALDASVHFGRRLEARFQCPIDLRSIHHASHNPSASSAAPSCANQGTLVVFNLDSSTSAEEIRSLFSSVGDVKEIRATPNKKHHKFVEFYDVRDAERAMHLLNKTEVAGKRIKIEISRPGGRAANLSRAANHAPKLHGNNNNSNNNNNNASTTNNHSSDAIAINNTNNANSSNLSHFSRHHSATIPHVQYDNDPFAASSVRHLPDASSPLRMSSPLRTSSPFNTNPIPTSQTSTYTIPSSEVSFDMHPFDPPNTVSPRMRSMLAPSGFDATNALAGSLDKSFADSMDIPMLHHSLDSIPETHPLDFHSAFTPEQPEVSRCLNTDALAHPLAQKPAHDSYMQALYHSPPRSEESRSGLGTPPLDGSSTARNQFSPIRSNHNIARAADVDSSPTFRQPSYAETTSAGAVARPHGNLANAAASANNHSARKMGNGAMERPSTGSHRHANPSKSSSHSASHGHGKPYVNQHHVNSKYVLDISKVRSGDETRTALMIRNIPNKYNQKMLLSTLEDQHRGHFDFVYLPIDFKNKCNVGYAFINFTKPEHIEPFYNAFHGKKWGRFNSEKVCEITFARIQGRQQLIAHFQNSSLLLEDPKCRPVIFDSAGRQEEFPIGSHVRTRRGPSSRDAVHRSCDTPPFSPTKSRSRS